MDKRKKTEWVWKGSLEEFKEQVKLHGQIKDNLQELENEANNILLKKRQSKNNK